MAPSDQVEPFALDEADAPQDGWDDPVPGRLRWRTLFSKGMTPTQGMTCGVTELRPGDWLGLHRHAPAEIYYVFAGAGLMSRDGRELSVKAGSAVFIPGRAEHGLRQTGSEILRLFTLSRSIRSTAWNTFFCRPARLTAANLPA